MSVECGDHRGNRIGNGRASRGEVAAWIGHRVTGGQVRTRTAPVNRTLSKVPMLIFAPRRLTALRKSTSATPRSRAALAVPARLIAAAQSNRSPAERFAPT